MTEGIPLGRDKTLAQNVFKGLMCRDVCEVVIQLIHDTQRDLKWLICRLILYLRRRRGCAEFQKTADLANIYMGYFSPVLGFATCGIEANEQQLQAFPKK